MSEGVGESGEEMAPIMMHRKLCLYFSTPQRGKRVVFPLETSKLQLQIRLQAQSGGKWNTLGA